MKINNSIFRYLVYMLQKKYNFFVKQMFYTKYSLYKLLLILLPIILISLSSFNNSSKITTTNHHLSKDIDTDTIKPIITDQGNLYITNYPSLASHQSWAITQDARGQMIFANKQGIIIFNGNKSTKVQLNSIPFSLKNLPELEIVLVGCDNQFGYITYNSRGEYVYKVLSDTNIGYGEITDIKLSDSHIFFYSSESLSIYNRKTLEKVSDWFVQDNIKQNGIFIFNNELFISKTGNGLYKVNINGKKKLINRSINFSKNSIVFSLSLSKNKLLLGSSSSMLYSFDGKILKRYKGVADKYMSETQLVGGVALQNNQFVLSTLSNGIAVVDKVNNKIVNIINYQNGLPDDEILASYVDKHGNIWLSHGFGISKVNYGLPIKDYNFYPGIEGKLIDVLEYDNTIYVATTEGVFYLDTLTDIQKLNTIIKTSLKIGSKNKKKLSKSQNNNENLENTPQEKKKKNIFQRWKEKREKRRQKRNKEKKNIEENKKKESQQKQNKVSATAKKQRQPTRKRIVYRKKSKQILTVSYVFKKVKKIKAKCKQLVKYKGVILVATNNGLFEIRDHKSSVVIKNIYVNTIVPAKTDGLFYIGSNSGLTAIKYKGDTWKQYKKIQPNELEDKILSIAQDSNGNIWAGSDVLVYRIIVDKKQIAQSFEIFDFDKQNPDNFEIRLINNDICFVTSNEIYVFDPIKEIIKTSDQSIADQHNFTEHIMSQSNITWLKYGTQWRVIGNNKLQKQQLDLINLFSDIKNINIDKDNNIWLIDGNNNLFKILKSKISIKDLSTFKVYIQKIQDDKSKNVKIDNVILLGQSINSITFHLSAPYYIRPKSIKYQYIVKPLMTDWSEWKESSEIDFIPHSGTYTVSVRAKNIFGNIVSSREYNMEVQAPIWEQVWFIIMVTLVLSAIITLIFILSQKRKEKRLRKYNKELEQKVEERTLQIQEQKDQIERKNTEITDSINYASQIQTAILPPLQIMKKFISESFILNRPKNIVSGDFYWLSRVDNSLIITVADCTGHGVPGAFLSILGVTFLNEIILKIDILHANTILNILRKRIIKSLNQKGYQSKRLDGIDLALIILNLETNELEYAGANNPAYIVRNNNLTEIKADDMPIGMHFHSDKPFTNHTAQVQKGDMIYLFSDGYVDQFGGKQGRKFLSKNFKELIKTISVFPMEEQKNILNETIETWKGDRPQLDDILIMGLRV